MNELTAESVDANEEFIALCVSCLRIKVFATYDDASKSDCVCGATGEDQDASAFCPCGSCAHSAQLMLDGQRTDLPAFVDGFVLPDGWTAEAGKSPPPDGV